MSTPSSLLPADTLPVDAGLGVDELRRRGLRRFWMALPSYLAVLALLGLGVWTGSVPPGVGGVIAAMMVLALLAIHVVLRHGWAARSQDPILAFTQSSFSIGIVAIGYALLDDLRSTALLWLSVIVVFDLWRLPRRQVRLAMMLCVVLPLLATASRHYWHPVPMDWLAEVFTLLILAVVLPVLYAVSGQARAARDRHAQQKQQMAETLARLRQMAIRDGLTGLYNRRHMLVLLEDEVKRSRRTGRPFSVTLLDLDFFKRVNDEHGHAVGDAVLRAFAGITREVFPGSADMFARWGGEEFLLLQAETANGDAVAAMTRLQEACREHDWSRYAPGLHVSFSAGVCQHRRQDSADHTLELADRALYEAKAEGRDRIVVHGPLQPSMAKAVRPARAAPPHEADEAGPDAPSQPTWTDLAMGDMLDGVEGQPLASSASFERSGQGGFMARMLGGVLDFLCGPHRKLRPAMALCALSMCVYLTSIAGFLLYVIPSGLLTRTQGMCFVAHNLLAVLVPYTVLRLGVTLNWRDPSIVLPQVIWGGTGVIIGYGMMPSTSPSTLQMVCLSLVFGFTSLRPKETLWVGRYYVGLMLSVWAVVAARAVAIGQGEINLRRVGMEVLMTCVVLWFLTLQSRRLSTIREKVREEKRRLTEATERVSQIMVRDPLTDLYNRQYMQVLLKRECDRHRRSGQSFSVALIDLDHFKAINDDHGHATGDEVLTSFAKAARAHLRDSDVLCRWGGEEFLVLLVGADPGTNGMLAMGRLKEALSRAQLCADMPDLAVTFSAGVAEHRPEEPIARTLQRADEALYAAKAAGRDRCLLSALDEVLPPSSPAAIAAAPLQHTA